MQNERILKYLLLILCETPALCRSFFCASSDENAVLAHAFEEHRGIEKFFLDCASSKRMQYARKKQKMEEKKMENAKKSNKKVVIGVIALVALVAILAAVYFVFSPKPVAGSKAITIEVVNKAQESTVYELQTDAEYLRQAMEEAEGLTFSGAESEFGMMVDTVNGERADYTLDGAYWSFSVNGEYSNYGIETQPVLDGDAFAITYTLAQ